MDIQEAIQHCLDVAAGATEQGKCPECAADHEQLAGWLTVLKQIAEIFNCDPNDPAQLKRLCDKLRDWQQADQDGRRVVLPCKVGDTVYFTVESRWDSATMLLSQFYTLTEEEIACIRYHMGAFTDKAEWDDYTRAVRLHPNVLWTHHADMLASHVKGV